MPDGHLGRIIAARPRIDLLKDDVRPVYFGPHRAGMPSRKFALANMGRMITEKMIERVSTEWAAPNVFAPKKDCSLHLCVNY